MTEKKDALRAALREAADRIDALEGEVARLRGALREARVHHENTCGTVGELSAMVEAFREMRARAEAAETEAARLRGWQAAAHNARAALRTGGGR